MPTQRSTTSQALRRFALGAGPLKRASDRVQFLARLLLVCSLVMAIPVALVVASVAHTRAIAEVTAQSLDRQQVDAVLTADPTVAEVASARGPRTDRAPATWPGPTGTESGDLVVPLGAKAGSTVTIWVDGEGNHTTAPLDGDGAAAEALGMALLTYLCLSSLAAGVYVAVRVSLDRSRLRRWERDWAVIGPVWTREVH